ncbi:type I Iterative Polyketide synthase (PKS) [Aspergillus niger]|nr:type I Iterative Polyketide synthase (PKS) [Aspergillus niger]
MNADPSDRQDSTATAVPVAICGMGMRLPGGIHDDATLYEFLLNGKDARSYTGCSRYDVRKFYDPTPRPGTIQTKHGYWLQDIDLSNFDTSMFKMSGPEVERLDPQQRLLLEVVWEAMQNAGETRWQGKEIGCYVGSFREDWLILHHSDPLDINPFEVSGSVDLALANRISYEFDFKGPSIILTPGVNQSLNGVGVFSAEGSCKSFDASADGYARAEAVNAIYVKRLDLAIRDGNPIRAVIRATAVNSDGNTSALVRPSADAHEQLIRKAYRRAGILNFSETAMVECHSTGTAIGDPIEADAIARVFGDEGIHIGSAYYKNDNQVKPNLGHPEGAAALNSIMKSVLSLERGIILPNIKFDDPNPSIPFQEGKLVVPLQATPWPGNRRKRISINSFGIGGANVHVTPTDFEGWNHCRLLTFSAAHPESLVRVIESHQQYIKQHPDRLPSLEFTLLNHREHLLYRGYCVTTGKEPLHVSVQSKSKPPSQVCFVFNGQGGQWAQMGKELMEQHPTFHEDIRRMDRYLQRLQDGPRWTIEAELSKPKETSHIDLAPYAQPLTTALQVALVNLLVRWNITPSNVVGHSSGEIAAAYAAGVLDMEEAIIVSYFRGKVFENRKRRGAMAAVALGRKEISSYLEPGVVIACENSASSVTLSGDKEALETVTAALQIKEPSASIRNLIVDTAYHSPHMREVGEPYLQSIASHVKPKPPKVQMWSTVAGSVLPMGSSVSQKYWKTNLENPVLFSSAINSLLAEYNGSHTFLEIGPHSTLAAPLNQLLRAGSSDSSYAYIPTLKRGQNSSECFLAAVGQLFAIGNDVRCPSAAAEARVLTDLPAYPWHHDRKFWQETRVMRASRLPTALPHDLLGRRILEGNELYPTWRIMLELRHVPWLRDHCVHKDVVFPAAAYISMVGEAIRQLTGEVEYTLKNVVFHTAMIIPETGPKEIITVLERQRLTNTSESSWYRFNISSYDETTCKKHCTGLACAGSTPVSPDRATRPLPRKIQGNRFYKSLARAGFIFGPSFRRLVDIFTDVMECTAQTTVIDDQPGNESKYALHPITLDSIFQSLILAACKGDLGMLLRVRLPTLIQEISVGHGVGRSIEIHSHINEHDSDTVKGYSYAYVEDEIVSSVKGFCTRPLDVSGLSPMDSKVGYLQWAPDSSFQELGSLIKVTMNRERDQVLGESLFLLCALGARQDLEKATPAQPHLHRYRAWILLQLEKASRSENSLVKNSVHLFKLSPKDRDQMINMILDEAQSSDCRPIFELILKIYNSFPQLFDGSLEPLSLLMQDYSLGNIYNTGNATWDYEALFAVMGHSKPQMKILEIGGGTASLSENILQYLQSEFEEPLYQVYTFTDISTGFLSRARERLHHYPNVDYQLLDISKDPEEQGLGKESYDLIIASNVVHVTPSLHDTLTHIRKLLRPDGRLFLAEICAVTKVFNFVMGILPSWWVGENDGRVDEPYIAPEEWHSRLYKAGFTQIEASISDTEPPFRVNATFMARTARQDFVPERVTLLSKGFVGKPARHVERMLLEMGCKVQHVLWGSTTPIQQDIISFIELEGPLFEGITDTDMEFFQGLVKSLRNVKMLWLMKPAQLHVDDPRFGLSLGMIRTIRSELGLVFATLELDDASSGNSTRAITEVFKHIRGKNVQRGRFDLDVEYVYSQGAVHVGRYHWSSFSRELEQRVPPGSANELIVGQLGVLQSLKWAPRQLGGLSPHDVRIKVHAVGLNFKDVLLASGILDLKGESAMLGIEGSGIVTAVGTDVANFSVGDRVMALSSHQSLMASEAQVASTHCIKIPNRLGFVEAATMPCVYLTVLRSLVDKAQLQKGQSILIHSASGGVGIAAITVARWIGAEVLVTAGTDEKRTFLMRQFGILPSRVFDSRDRTFVDGVRAITSGRGVDVVLNSVSGELLHASWECVASGGCMIELGKRDILGNGNLAMHPFGDNRSFIGIDLGHLSIKAPVIIERLLQQAVRLYENGDIEPINPVRSFSARKVQEAFQHLRQGQHIGKVVLALTEGDAPELAPIVSTPMFRKDAAYLLVGGLGGLGGSIATWMASHGAGNLVTLSRSGNKSEDDRHIVAEIEAFGCSVQMFKGDVSKEEDVRHLVRNTSRPIAGMVHMAMVLSDAPVLDMTVAHWEAAINPKVKGAWNLHNVLPKNLDFFILFASLSGNLGYYGQSNYAAANTFLDAFVQYRHGLNLPASVIDLGAVEDVGFVSRHPEILKRLNNTFGQTVSEEELRNAFHLAVTRPGPGRPDIGKHPASRHYNASQIAVGLVPTSTAAFLARDPRLSVFYNLKQGQKTQRKKQDSKLDTFVDDIKTNPTLLDDPNSVRLISREIRKQVETLMMIEPQSDGALPTLSQIGVDSLVGIEIQNWWRSMFGVDVTLLQLLEADSFQKLGELAVRQLDELTRGDRESPDETSSKEQSSALDNRAESHRTVSQTKPYDAGNNIAPSSPYYDMFREDHNNVSFEGKRLRDDGHVVILTGSTGTLGAYILLELLQMPNIHRVYCLCRSADAASRQIRGFQLQGLEVPGSFKNRVEYIRVDLPAPKLGMPDTKYEELRLSVDIVIHCAWELSFSKAFDIFERIHIRGLSRLFELSQRCQYRPHIHFMSSLLALYAKETQSSSSNVQGPGQKPASPWPIGYTESKLIAEEMCRLASTKWGLPTTVYRIGQIAGSSSGNGVVWDRNQWLPSIMHSSKLIRKVPNSLGPAEVTWMPVDQAAKAICEIFQSRSSSDGVVDSNVTFNVVNPCLTRWESLLPVIQKHYAAEVVESDIWLSEVEKHESLTGGSAETIPTRLLLPLYRQIMELFNHGWTRPSYDTERTNMASETLRNMGPITPEMMERWIQQWNF